MTFTWTKPEGIADWQERCEVSNLVLWASGYGEWVVARREGDRYKVFTDSLMQTKGVDLEDAKRRAENAAMIALK